MFALISASMYRSTSGTPSRRDVPMCFFGRHVDVAILYTLGLLPFSRKSCGGILKKDPIRKNHSSIVVTV